MGAQRTSEVTAKTANAFRMKVDFILTTVNGGLLEMVSTCHFCCEFKGESTYSVSSECTWARWWLNEWKDSGGPESSCCEV